MPVQFTYSEPDEAVLFLAMQGRKFGLSICSENGPTETKENVRKLADILLTDHDAAQKETFVGLMLQNIASDNSN